jgi:ribosome recycling factor
VINYIYEKADLKMKEIILTYKQKLNKINIRINTSIIGNIKINYYETMKKISEISTIKIVDQRIIEINPWEKKISKNIEKGILTSNLDIIPINNGNIIKITIPQITEEKRKKIVLQIKNTSESTKISIRNIRKVSNNLLKEEKKNKNISIDDERRGLKLIQSTTNEYIAQINSISLKKSKNMLDF